MDVALNQEKRVYSVWAVSVGNWQPREPQLTPGADGNLNPALSCKYCKDTGHEVGNCTKVKRKEALKAAAAAQSAPKPKGN